MNKEVKHGQKNNNIAHYYWQLIVVVGLLTYSQFFSQQQVEVGGVYFDLPDGYYQGSDNNIGDITITNGNYSVFLVS